MNNEGSRIFGDPSDSRVPMFDDLQFLLRPNTIDNDETVQFAADTFVDKLFCVPPSKNKRNKEPFKGLADAIARQDHVRIQASSISKENNNHNKQQHGTVEDVNRRIIDSLRTSEENESTKQRSDPTEIKAKELATLLEDGFEFYSLQQYASAATKYRLAWDMLVDVTLELQLENIEEDVVCYMLCLSLLETDQLSNLSEAVELLISLEKRSSRKLPAVYYALSKAHQKHYRYELALKSIGEGFAVLDGDTELTEYIIPGTNTILKESTREGLSVSLAAMKDECSKWHPPDASCCADECIPTSRWYGPNRNIYFSDPAFNGMVVLTCSNRRFPCTMKFHQGCWKLKKDQMSVVKKLSDKDVIGHECFTPDCEYGQGERSVISKVEVYGDDRARKTLIEAPANPLPWIKRDLVTKGAIPKQPPKQKRHLEKKRRPVNVPASASRTHCKESLEEDRLKRAEGLIELAKLRQNNFGIKPECEWRPDLVMYGNPQMSEVVDFLEDSAFEKDPCQVAATKIFIITYFYEYIKENGCVSKRDILQKWEEDKYTICDHFNDVLRENTDIVDFLLQSYKLVSIGAYIGIAENLPELYSLVRDEVGSYLRFSIAEPVRSSTAITQDEIYNTVINDFDEKRNKDQENVSARTAEVKATTNQIHRLAVAFSDSPSLELEATDSQETSSEVTLMHSREINGTSDCQKSPRETVTCSVSLLKESKSSNDYVELGECIAFPLLRDETLVSGGATEPNNGVRPIFISDEEKEGSEIDADDVNDALNNYNDQFQKTESINSENRTLLVDYISSQESDISVSSDCENLNFDEKIEPSSDLNSVQSSTISSPSNDNPDEMEPTKDKIPSTEICTAHVKLTENDGVEKFEDPPEAQKNPGENKSEIDMAIMVQKLVTKFMNDRIVSQPGMTDLTEDLKRLEERYAKLETRKKEITSQLETCQRELRQTTDENIILNFEKDELTHEYGKLNEAKAEIQRNFDKLLSENSTIKSQVLTLQKERDRMYKILEECPTGIKEQIIRQSKRMESTDAEGTESEQWPSEDMTNLIARKAKIESLDREFVTNNILLEKAFEKCYDHLRMYAEVEKLITLINGEPFAMGEAIKAWKNMEYYLQHAIVRYKADYSSLKALLESNQPIENSDIKLHIPSIAFPQTPYLSDVYTRWIRNKLTIQQMHWTSMPRGNLQNPYGFPLPSRPYFPNQKMAPPNVCYAAPIPNDRGSLRDLRADAVERAQAEQISPKNDGLNAGWVHQIEGRRTSNDSINAGTLVEDGGIAEELEPLPPTVTNASGMNEDHPIGRNLYESVPQVSTDRQSITTKKIGTDSLIQKLRVKFEGVPETDLFESVQDVRRMHNNSLTGMRVEDIIRKAEHIIKLRQEKHMVPYSSPVQSLLSTPPASKPNQRKIPPLIPPGQCKNTKSFSTAEQPDYFASNSFDPPSTSKKPAWGSVTSTQKDWEKSYVDSECSICMEGMNASNEEHPVYTLPCKHSFHTACIKQWLGATSVCPICRIHCTMDDEFPPLP